MYDTCFKEVKVTDIPFDKSIKQCGNESSSFFSTMMKSIFAVLQQSWEKKGCGPDRRRRRNWLLSRISDDNCYMVSQSRKQLFV